MMQQSSQRGLAGNNPWSCRTAMVAKYSRPSAASRHRCITTARGVSNTDTAACMHHRRMMLLSAASMLLGASVVLEAQASNLRPNQEVDAADSQFIQDMLQRTEENRERRYQERLADYSRRNFKEYFEFEAGSLEAAKARGISEETYNAIKKWLKDNGGPRPKIR